MVDLIAGHLGIEVEEKQKLLENLIISERLEQAYSHMQSEVSVLQVEKKIKTRVKSQMERTQREYYLNEQMKAIQSELGDKDDLKTEILEFEESLKSKDMPEDIKKRVENNWHMEFTIQT